MPEQDRPPQRTPLLAVALLFLRLGLTAFGGPAAHVALMEREVVQKRRWLSSERFLDMYGAASLIPGPSSSELAIFIGYEHAGIAGLFVAGVCFIVPAALMAGGLAWAYVRFGALPHVGGLLYGVKPIVLAIVAQALYTLAPKALKNSPWLLVLGGAACIVAVATSLDPIALLVCTGALAALPRLRSRPPDGSSKRGLLALTPLAGATSSGGLLGIFLVFVKIGALVFGSGYVLLAFLRAELVVDRHWLTEPQLLDAVVVGQVTPGPVFTTATFIGYLLGRTKGAIVATIGIFLPGFLLVAAIRPLVARVRRSPALGAFLDGVNIASLALMAVVLAQLAHATLVDVPSAALAIVGAVLLLRFKVNATWLLAGAAVVGAVIR